VALLHAKVQFSIEVLSSGSFQSLFIIFVPGSLASKHETGPEQAPPPFLTASTFADRFEVTCGQVAKELQAYAYEEGVVHFFNFRTPKVNIILDFVPL
jgi:hypothetical protein